MYRVLSVPLRAQADGALQASEPAAAGGGVQPRLRRPQPLHLHRDPRDLAPDQLQLDLPARRLQLRPGLRQDRPRALVVLHQQAVRDAR